MDLVINISTLIGFTLGITEIIKRAVASEKFTRFIPLVSLIVGVGMACFQFGPVRESVFMGILVGLSASGLYSGSKTTLGF